MPNQIIFEKMHGAGNDFIVIDNRFQNFIPNKVTIQNLSNRNTGIGFDQLILIDDSDLTQCDASYRFFNPDGTEAEQCGNGQRCISHYLYTKTPNQSKYCVSGLAGLMHSQIIKNGLVMINMGSTRTIQSIQLKDSMCYEVNFGNPHLIHIIDNVDSIDLSKLNSTYTSKYPDGINFEAVQIIDSKTIKLRVHERGTGETQACGSGACATVAALQFDNKLSDKVKVILPGGNLVVEYKHKDNNYYLSGPAVHVFTGEISI